MVWGHRRILRAPSTEVTSKGSFLSACTPWSAKILTQETAGRAERESIQYLGVFFEAYRSIYFAQCSTFMPRSRHTKTHEKQSAGAVWRCCREWFAFPSVSSHRLHDYVQADGNTLRLTTHQRLLRVLAPDNTVSFESTMAGNFGQTSTTRNDTQNRPSTNQGREKRTPHTPSKKRKSAEKVSTTVSLPAPGHGAPSALKGFRGMRGQRRAFE